MLTPPSPQPLIMTTTPIPSTSRPNLDSIFTSAFQAHKQTTGKDISLHPLAAELQSYDSPDAILAALRRQIPASRKFQSGYERWLTPTVNVLSSFSAALGGGAGLVNITIPHLLRIFALTVIRQVFPLANVIFESAFSSWPGFFFFHSTAYFDIYI